MQLGRLEDDGRCLKEWDVTVNNAHNVMYTVHHLTFCLTFGIFLKVTAENPKRPTSFDKAPRTSRAALRRREICSLSLLPVAANAEEVRGRMEGVEMAKEEWSNF